jgi:hypothetical protein
MIGGSAAVGAQMPAAEQRHQQRTQLGALRAAGAAAIMLTRPSRPAKCRSAGSRSQVRLE